MQLLILFILKLMDNALSTMKNLLLIKNKNFLSSLANALSQYFYLTMLVYLTKNSSNLGVIVICISAFLGSFIPQLLFDKLEKDKVFVFNITPSTNEKGKELADSLRENNIAVQTYKSYNNDKEQILCIKAFSENKKESILLEQLIPVTCTYSIIELKHYNAN